MAQNLSARAGIASKQIQRIMGDLRGEVANIKAGAARARLWQRSRLRHLSFKCAWLIVVQ